MLKNIMPLINHTSSSLSVDQVEDQRKIEATSAFVPQEVTTHSQFLAPSPIIQKSKQDKRTQKISRKMSNQRERLQAVREPFETDVAEAHIDNQGVIDIIAEIDEVGTTTHNEWYGDLCNTDPTLDEWYDHAKAPKFNKIDEEAS